MAHMMLLHISIYCLVYFCLIYLISLCLSVQVTKVRSLATLRIGAR